jgi:hypothetical protein
MNDSLKQSSEVDESLVSVRLGEYQQRQKEWRDISTNQFSVTNNILITLSAGYLALAFDKAKLEGLSIKLQAKIDWPLVFYLSTLLLIIASIIIGVSVMFSRLYDARLSRYIALTRQRFYKKYKKGLPDSESELGPIHFWDRLKSLCSVLFMKLDFMTKEDIDNFNSSEKSFKERFNKLRRQARILGTASWRWTKLQVGLTLLSIMTYLIHLMLK